VGIVEGAETVGRHVDCRWGIDAEEIVELEMEATFDPVVDNHMRRLLGQGCSRRSIAQILPSGRISWTLQGHFSLTIVLWDSVVEGVASKIALPSYAALVETLMAVAYRFGTCVETVLPGQKIDRH